MAQHPLLALPAARLRGHGVVLSPRTEVVIEGYPRSANSFAVAAFRLALGSPSLNPIFDFNGDGNVDFSDLAQFRMHLGTVLPP